MSKICFDLRCLQIGHEKRGIGMHAISVLENLKKSDNIEYFFYIFDDKNPIDKLGIKLNIDYTIIKTKTLKRSIHGFFDIFDIARLVFHRFKILDDYNLDSFVQFDFMLGLPKSKKINKILIAYDLIPLILKKEYLPSPLSALNHKGSFTSKIKRFIRSGYYILKYYIQYKNFNKADRIVSISKDTSKQINSILGVNSKKIKVISLAPVLNINTEKKPKSLMGIGKDEFIFYIGATDNRKKVQDLVSSFNTIKGRGYNLKLILAGSEFKSIKKIPNTIIKDAVINSSYIDDIILTGYLDDEEKVWLYKNAKAFVFPTIYEGFGLPVIEAMLCGCPVISYDNSSIPEVSGGAALLVETNNNELLTKAILEIINNDTSDIIKKGYIVASKFSWNKHVKELLNYINS